MVYALDPNILNLKVSFMKVSFKGRVIQYTSGLYSGQLLVPKLYEEEKYIVKFRSLTKVNAEIFENFEFEALTWRSLNGDQNLVLIINRIYCMYIQTMSLHCGIAVIHCFLEFGLLKADQNKFFLSDSFKLGWQKSLRI